MASRHLSEVIQLSLVSKSTLHFSFPETTIVTGKLYLLAISSTASISSFRASDQHNTAFKQRYHPSYHPYILDYYPSSCSELHTCHFPSISIQFSLLLCRPKAFFSTHIFIYNLSYPLYPSLSLTYAQLRYIGLEFSSYTESSKSSTTSCFCLFRLDKCVLWTSVHAFWSALFLDLAPTFASYSPRSINSGTFYPRYSSNTVLLSTSSSLTCLLIFHLTICLLIDDLCPFSDSLLI